MLVFCQTHIRNQTYKSPLYMVAVVVYCLHACTLCVFVSLRRTIVCSPLRSVSPPFSAGYKIHNLTLTPAHERLSVGERLVLNCTVNTELNVAIDFTWTHPLSLAPVNGSVRAYTTSHKKKLM
ncbi:vascular endothelial growth factor receptor 2-like [Coregonus clupeaformis]|uniref:vascular endothelial growth factor receptor 2-like n=1 Tax=Coregonus clupeaformis TaxID=59861 RepID=UPI001E1C4FBE|nr:vascular endothelial growth factor receptor 2-like [Coregonus clupeaformis]